MPVGPSGRVVLEIDPQLKRRLYSALALDQMHLKDWFRAQVERYLADQEQGSLFPPATTENK